MMLFRKTKLISLCLTSLLLLTLPLVGCSKAEPVELNVSAAASLSDALEEINVLYMGKHENVTVVANFASSGTLQKQIEQGAPADVFISAGAKQMQALQDSGLIINDTRISLLNNKIVLTVPGNSTLTISSFNDLVNDDVEKIAIGDPESVPAGTYGKQAMEQLGIYEQVQAKLILCTDVRQVLSYVEAGNVDAGIVYATDAAGSTGVKVVADAPAEVNVVYPAAIIKATKIEKESQAYMDFITGPEAKTIFKKYGFIVVAR